MAWDLINEPRCYKCGNSVQVQSASDGLTTYLGCLGPEVNGCGAGQGRAGQGRAGLVCLIAFGVQKAIWLDWVAALAACRVIFNMQYKLARALAICHLYINQHAHHTRLALDTAKQGLLHWKDRPVCSCLSEIFTMICSYGAL